MSRHRRLDTTELKDGFYFYSNSPTDPYQLVKLHRRPGDEDRSIEFGGWDGGGWLPVGVITESSDLIPVRLEAATSTGPTNELPERAEDRGIKPVTAGEPTTVDSPIWPHLDHEETRRKFWVDVWISTNGCGEGICVKTCTDYADRALKAYDERFPVSSEVLVNEAIK